MHQTKNYKLFFINYDFYCSFSFKQMKVFYDFHLGVNVKIIIILFHLIRLGNSIFHITIFFGTMEVSYLYFKNYLK